ncbi:MAG: 30S ribosomal protein S9 [Lentisphaeria bacterium]|nr:30S ribosomal protein S9 [Lentisphaeria bacterium]
MTDKKELWTVGRRKCAVARVKTTEGTGQIKVNGKTLEGYFTVEAQRGYLMQPLDLTGVTEFDYLINVKGGGMAGQSGAVRHGIARAIQTLKPELRSVLKEAGMLTRDSRVKERNKPGQPGARRKFQFSKR